MVLKALQYLVELYPFWSGLILIAFFVITFPYKCLSTRSPNEASDNNNKSSPSNVAATRVDFSPDVEEIKHPDSKYSWKKRWSGKIWDNFETLKTLHKTDTNLRNGVKKEELGSDDDTKIRFLLSIEYMNSGFILFVNAAVSHLLKLIFSEPRPIYQKQIVSGHNYDELAYTAGIDFYGMPSSHSMWALGYLFQSCTEIVLIMVRKTVVTAKFKNSTRAILNFKILMSSVMVCLVAYVKYTTLDHSIRQITFGWVFGSILHFLHAIIRRRMEFLDLLYLFFISIWGALVKV